MKLRDVVREDAVGDLKQDLRDPRSYDAIDHMMQTIAKKHGITPKELHNRFVEKTGKIPDEWFGQKLDELYFKGSQCTKDCSGHMAGYAWSQKKGGIDAASWSPSFNKGAALFKNGF